MMEFMRQEEASRASLCGRQPHSVLGTQNESRRGRLCQYHRAQTRKSFFFSLKEAANSCFGDKKEGKKKKKKDWRKTNETGPSQIRISYYSNKKYIHTEI